MAGADAMRERIAAHPWPRGGVEVVRANRGSVSVVLPPFFLSDLWS